MKKKIIPVSIFALLAAGGLYFGFKSALAAWQQGPAAESAPAKQERKILYWVDPMHPQYKSDKPGKAPDCGMDLVPVYAGKAPEEMLPPGVVQINPQRLQLIGVRYGKVAYGPLTSALRTVGKVTFDETRVAHIHTKVTGYIEQVFVDFVGKEVKRGDPLFTLYSPELLATQQEYLIALRSQKELEEAPYAELATSARSLVEAARERLRLWDIPDEEIETIHREGKVRRALTIYSPVSGVVTERAAYHHGRYVSPEMDLYTVVDLSTIWVLADVYEYELPMIKLGMPATVTIPSFPGWSFRGKVTYINPQLDNQTRTAKVRLEFPNPDLSLKPDMYANIELQMDYGKQIWVPAEAVLDSGAEQTVFVARGEGYFEPRKVGLGAKVGDRVIILKGLRPGEKIVTSGNFLIDSESSLKSAMGAMAGMEHGAAPSGGAKSATPDQPKPPAAQGTSREHPAHEPPKSPAKTKAQTAPATQEHHH